MTMALIAIGGAVANLIVAELFGWLPWLAARVISRAARLLPTEARDRYRDEWLAELDMLPARGLSSLLFSLRVLVGAPKVAREISGRQRAGRFHVIATSALASLAADAVLTTVAVVLAVHGAGAIGEDSSWLLGIPFLAVGILHQRGFYRSGPHALLFGWLGPIVTSMAAATLIAASAGYVIDGEGPESSLMIRVWLLASVGLCVRRLLFASYARWASARRLVSRNVLIIGAGIVGAQVARRLATHPEYGFTPIGFLDDDPLADDEAGGRHASVLGTIDDLEKVVAATRTQDVIIAFSGVTDARVSRLIPRCQELGVRVAVVPRMFDLMNDRVGYHTVGGLPLLSFTPVDPKGMQFGLKHASDRMLALLMLILFSPVLLVAALGVKLSSPGPILFRQRRVGRDGRVFDFYKFRSMRDIPPPKLGEGHEISALDFLLGDDVAPRGVEGEDRRTAVGRFLRGSSLDELPQLFNVLRGDMSLVGPRPERPEFVELFRNDIIRYSDRHRVKSGITGWAQVHGLGGQTSLAERVEWDNYYIAHWSLGLDLKILALTVMTLIRNAD